MSRYYLSFKYEMRNNLLKHWAIFCEELWFKKINTRKHGFRLFERSFELQTLLQRIN